VDLIEQGGLPVDDELRHALHGSGDVAEETLPFGNSQAGWARKAARQSILQENFLSCCGQERIAAQFWAGGRGPCRGVMVALDSVNASGNPSVHSANHFTIQAPLRLLR
jgi:hypothetical protein